MLLLSLQCLTLVLLYLVLRQENLEMIMAFQMLHRPSDTLLSDNEGNKCWWGILQKQLEMPQKIWTQTSIWPHDIIVWISLLVRACRGHQVGGYLRIRIGVETLYSSRDLYCEHHIRYATNVENSPVGQLLDFIKITEFNVIPQSVVEKVRSHV